MEYIVPDTGAGSCMMSQDDKCVYVARIKPYCGVSLEVQLHS